MALSAAQPLHAQNWMERYLQERRTKSAEKARAKEQKRQEKQERRERERELERNIPDPEATSLSDVAPQEDGEVRRALPLEPFEQTEQPQPTQPQPQPQPEHPTQTETVRIPRAVPVERAIPVEPVVPVERTSEPQGEVRKALPVEPFEPATQPAVPPAAPERDPAPEPSRGAPVNPETPGVPTQEPAAPHAEAVPEETKETGETAAQRPPSTLEVLDPRSREIRLSPGTTTAPADVAQILLANGFYTRKQYDQAAPEYERYLSLFPSGVDRQAAFFRLAECYRQLGSFNAARQNYEALIYTFQIGDFIGPASYRLAELYYQEKDYSAAVTFFRKASVWVKDPAIALSAKFYAARSLEAAKMSSEAMRAYEDVLATEGENPFREASQLALVELLSDSGRRSQALLILNTLRTETAKESVKAEATVRIGLLQLDQKQNAKAAEEFAKALKMPELGHWKEIAELGLLRVLYNDGKYEPVLKAYEASEKTFSPAALPEVLLLVANSNRQLRRHDAARTLYDQIIRDYAQSPYAQEARYERLVILYTIDSPELVTEIDAYLASHPDAGARRDQLTLMKAESFYKTKQFEAATPLYASLNTASLAPALKAEALFKLGWCQTQTGDHAGAIQTFSAFLSRYPTNKLAATALAQRGFGYEQAKNYKAALGDFNEVLSRYPKAKEREFAIQRKALILGQQDESKAMVDAFTQLLKEFPNSPAAGQANYWIGLTAFQSKNYKDSIAPLVAARKQDADFADRATSLILAVHRYLENRDALAKEVDQAGPKIRIPAEMLRWLGNEYLKGNESDAVQAEKYLTKLTGSEGNDELIAADWLSLGQASIKLKKWAAAEKTLRTYLEKATDPIPKANGYLALGEAELGTGKLDAALKSANKVQELQPEGRLNALGRMLSGAVTAAKGDWEAAAKIYLSVALVYDDPVITPQALEQAYRAYLKSGNEPQSKKVLNDLQSRYPEYRLSKVEAR